MDVIADTDDAVTRLVDWAGSSAQVWDYTASLSTLRVLLRATSEHQFDLILLHGCERVSFETSFRGRFAVERPVATDAVARYRITCGDAFDVTCGTLYVMPDLGSIDEIPKSPLAHGS